MKPSDIKQASALLSEVEEIDKALNILTTSRNDWSLDFVRRGGGNSLYESECPHASITCAALYEQTNFLRALRESRVKRLQEMGVEGVPNVR